MNDFSDPNEDGKYICYIGTRTYTLRDSESIQIYASGMSQIPPWFLSQPPMVGASELGKLRTGGESCHIKLVSMWHVLRSEQAIFYHWIVEDFYFL